jgi:pyridoxal phosphate enzyme (YggS family)
MGSRQSSKHFSCKQVLSIRQAKPRGSPVSIQENIKSIRKEMETAAAACGRKSGQIRLVAVSKNFPPDLIRAAIDAGQRDFGENRVQEAESKIPSFRSMPGLTWHMIGHLQTNKTHRAAELFDVIHSVDSLKLARKLSESALALGKTLSVLIQVDFGGEATKFGAERGEVSDLIAGILELRGVQLDGLMTLPPFFEDPELASPFFMALRELLQDMELKLPGCLGRRELSMGMSHDFAIAIREGATIVRIGTAIFGERNLVTGTTVENL